MKLLILVLSLSIAIMPVHASNEISQQDYQAMYEELHGNGIYEVADYDKAGRRAETFRNEVQDLSRLAERTNSALDGIFKIAVKNLKRKGYDVEAEEIETGWKSWNGKLQVLTVSATDIGDFDPLSTWLATAYDKIEAALGYQLCYMLRISDLKTLNFTIPVVFSPCKYGQDEFTKHFVHDAKYRGLAPVVAYWVTTITCSIATFGAGYFFICSPIAMLVEFAVDKKVAPWLAPIIFEKACGEEIVHPIDG